jgi:uncharacterized membrane protein YgdD (TMEM256/DUF423 family)
MKPFTPFSLAILVIAGLAGASAIGLSAFAAHRLPLMTDIDPRAFALFAQATDFQITHALALLAVTLLAEWIGAGAARCAFRTAAVLMAFGAIAFPSALYSRAFGGAVWWAPWGGTAAMIGWVAIAVGALLAVRQRRAA